MLHQHKAESPAKRLKVDLDLIDVGFTKYLRQRHPGEFTVAL
jgi:hypothetical protein